MVAPGGAIAEPMQVLRAYLSEHGLRASRQRDVIVETFLKAGTHITVDELLQRARAADPGVSQATVYRTVRLLTECGLAEARHFIDGQTRYEPSDRHGQHHDHLICTLCGTVVEFVDARIEKLQEATAKDHGFELSAHKMELYGLCRKCRKK